VAFNYSRAEDDAEAEATLAALRTAGVPVHAARADVADADAVTRLFGEVREALGGPPDVLVNNAAVTHDALLMMLQPAAWQRVIDVNLTGAYLCCRAALRSRQQSRNQRDRRAEERAAAQAGKR